MLVFGAPYLLYNAAAAFPAPIEFILDDIDSRSDALWTEIGMLTKLHNLRVSLGDLART